MSGIKPEATKSLIANAIRTELSRSTKYHLYPPLAQIQTEASPEEGADLQSHARTSLSCHGNQMAPEVLLNNAGWARSYGERSRKGGAAGESGGLLWSPHVDRDTPTGLLSSRLLHPLVKQVLTNGKSSFLSGKN